jgi:hypothetical protein
MFPISGHIGAVTVSMPVTIIIAGSLKPSLSISRTNPLIIKFAVFTLFVLWYSKQRQ